MYEKQKANDEPRWKRIAAAIFGGDLDEPISRPPRLIYLFLSLFIGAPYGVYLAVFKDRVVLPTILLLLWVVLSALRLSLLGTALLFGAGSAYLFALGIKMRINRSGVALLPFTVVFAAVFYMAWRHVWRIW